MIVVHVMSTVKDTTPFPAKLGPISRFALLALGSFLRCASQPGIPAQVVAEKYAVQAEMARLWMHYQPSYYHLHVHVAHSKWDGAGLNAGKAVLLADVIGESLVLGHHPDGPSVTGKFEQGSGKGICGKCLRVGGGAVPRDG